MLCQAGFDGDKRLLPYVSASIWALLVLLTLWTTTAKKSGGLQRQEWRSSAAAMLSAIVADVLVVSPSEISFPIFMQLDWKPEWPRPFAVCDVILPIFHGRIQWTRFVEQVRAKAVILGAGWWSGDAFDQLDTDMRGKTALTDLLQATCATPCLLSLHAQLVWAIGWTWQQLVIGLHTDKTKVHQSLCCYEVKDEDLMGCATDMDIHLGSYIYCSQVATSGVLHFNCSTDKASMCGLGSGVQGTIFTVPGNLAILSPPQALLFLSVCVL